MTGIAASLCLRLARAFGIDGPAQVPARVAEAIAGEAARAEILIGWAQATAIVFFAILYSASSKAFMPGMGIEPVPLTLSLYAVVTAGRILLAHKRMLNPGLVTASVVVDIAVLMALIWSFHVQYAQPPAFYLKAPTLLYVFILIALRALRFEPRYVVLAGICAALGWTFLLGYALLHHPTPGAITHDYIAYMTSARILVGAEVDKIISILAVTAVLALVLVRARATLSRAVFETNAARDLARFFAPEVARRITCAETGVRPGEGEARDAAIMFIDLRGFTPLSRTLPPHDVMMLLGEYQGLMVPIIQGHGGSIDKFLGDGILASFGAAVPSDRPAAEALTAADALAQAAEAWAHARRSLGLPAPEIGMGVAVGPVLFGAIGDPTRLEFTVIGDAVNLAAKLEKHTKALGVRALTTADALRRAEAEGLATGGRWSLSAERMVDGVPAPLDLASYARGLSNS